MDFGALPPEINSGRMYVGPGSGPMLAAAVVWDELAAELYATAAGYRSTLDGLTGGSWRGPASASMAAAAAPYVAWMTATAAQAELAGSQAKVAASAYETAFAATVPPPVIAANRALLMGLVFTNIFGQNTPAIAATEAHYAEMWAQDAAAMYAYAGSSATATQVTPFTEPPQITSPSGAVSQAAAVTEAATASASSDITAQLSPLIAVVPNALRGAASRNHHRPAELHYHFGHVGWAVHHSRTHRRTWWPVPGVWAGLRFQSKHGWCAGLLQPRGTRHRGIGALGG